MRELRSLLRRDEQVTLALRSLYEAHGYRKFWMSRFEEYDFYAVHRDFLANGQIISFTDLDGRLMALRPDVTLSIVKKAREGMTSSERLYYTEPIYRPARGLSGYRECYQVGVEYIGHVTPYAAVEMVSLAAQSLSVISAETVLDISHTGYLGGLLGALAIERPLRKTVQTLVEEKNLHELARAVDGILAQSDKERLLAVAALSGPFAQTLQKARALAMGQEMTAAVAELDALHSALLPAGRADTLRLDVSISGDAKYYSGLILRGYVCGVPGAVLSGGRYDPLLARMGKPGLSAMGFAIYFDELVRYFSAEASGGVDTVVLYGESASPAQVAAAVQACVDGGERVWAGTSLPQELSYARVVEVTGHA